MRQIAVLIAVAAAAGAAVLWAGNGPQGSVRLVGLQIVRPLPGDKRDQSLTGRRIGTTLTLAIDRADRKFLGVDEKASEIESFTDDKGTDFVPEAAKLLRSWIDGQTWVSGDGRRCAFEVYSTQSPAAGATRLSLRARMVFRCGLQPATVEQANFTLGKDGDVKAAPVPMKVTDVQFGPKTTIVTISCRDKPESIASIAFVDLDGQEVEMQELGASVVGFMGNAIYEQTFGLKKAVEMVTIRIKYYKKIERLTVPVNVSAGIGF